MQKTMKSRKFLSLLLALMMVLSILPMSAMAIDNPLVTTDTVDGLSVSVDYSTEKVYLEKVSSTEYNVLCDSTNGYYPFSLSMIMSDRTLVNGRPTVVTGGSFAWAYDESTGEESTTTPYGLATLPVGSTSTITVTTANSQAITFHCTAPNGGASAAGSSVYAFLPAPGQFTNEGVTSGGWGDIYDSTGTLKNNSSTGVSLGFFGGYVVYQFENPVANASTNPYGADFIVYGNAFWNNSELGCVQVSQNGTDWYDIAGSKYYDADTIHNASVTYTNPSVSEDAGITVAAANLGTLAAVTYTGSATGTITTNNFHKHSWFPLNANYFSGRYGNAALDKVDSLNFASRTLSNGVTDTLTLTGTMLGNCPTGSTASYGFGYCDVHPNNTLGGTIAYNPYQSFTSSSDYTTKTTGTSGGDPIDISWAVNSDGTPANLSSIQYVRVYTGTAQMNGIFGEISTESLGVAACTGTGSGAATTDLQVWGSTQIPTQNMGTQGVAPDIYYLISAEENVYVNGVKVAASPSYALTIQSGMTYQIITQNGTESPYITVLKGN